MLSRGKLVKSHYTEVKKKVEINNQGLYPGLVVSVSRINPLKINPKACSEQRSNVYTQGSKLRKCDNHKADVGPEKMCRLYPQAVQKAATLASKNKNTA